MKHLWRKIAIVMMIVFCLTGIALTIVDTVTTAKYTSLGFPTFLKGFVNTLALTAVWGLLIEFSKNVEDWLEKIFRNNAGLEQLPDTPDFITAGINKIANVANTANMQQPYPQQPMQQPYGQPPMNQPVNNFQAAPAPQPAPVPQPAPAPQPVPAPQAAPVPQPAPTPQSDTWTCSCGTANASQANFCKGCGKPRS
ncbi:MAG: hypothetical protein K2N06_07910 [Oscillospiraceae bacterium]|nr:hypothetical protein [Oscillospiraceae bacterium]